MKYDVRFRNKKRTFYTFWEAVTCSKNWELLSRADHIEISNERNEIVWMGSFDQLCAWSSQPPLPRSGMKLTVHVGTDALTYDSYSDLVRNGQKIVTKAVKLNVATQLTNELGHTEFQGTVFDLIFYAADKAGTNSRTVAKPVKKRKRPEQVKVVPV